MSVVLIRHATPASNLTSIRRHGLQPWRATGATKATWLHTSSLTAWAIVHVARRHKVPIGRVVILTVRVPRRQLRRWQRGVWICPTLIRPDQIVACDFVDEFARSVA